MATLTITNFSCIKSASLELTPVVVIIGPQGSGKSVTTKLNYFFADLISTHISFAERGDSFEDYKRAIGKQFREWFPPSAWGDSRFNISYSNGDFSVRVLRRFRGGRLSDELAITFSEWFEEAYRRSLEAFSVVRQRKDEDFFTSRASLTDPIERSWTVRDGITSALAKQLGSNYVHGQTFIPAGRAFFTSIGRLVAGFENAGSLDPVTIRFAKIFAQLRDRNVSLSLRSAVRRSDPEAASKQDEFMHRLFGGSFVFEDEKEFLQADDGRQIPINTLSSGQQEIFPIWAMLDYFGQIDIMQRSSKTRRREIIYIEEPEAHLFPSAQSYLLEFLFSSVERERRKLVITTHSPYIMARLNVFLKAGTLSRRKKKNTEINEVIPRRCWISDRELTAYAIEDNNLINIMDEEDGLIDSSYLDGISEDIGKDFDRLLEIEMDM